MKKTTLQLRDFLATDLRTWRQCAIDAKTKANHAELSKIQLGWLDRIEAQLLKEVVLNRETFESEAFKNKGGYNAVNKAFGQKLDEFIDEINGYMYSA